MKLFLKNAESERIFGARCQVVAKEKKDDEKTELLGKNLDD